ncbi:MAG TPA: PQQ-binding-like beta-propeller repeat protein [Thermoguttaceae bacterium]|nr:PQQ-binding-like beta-propeller repeat protein [Thermoguttaceae bacterium]
MVRAASTGNSLWVGIFCVVLFASVTVAGDAGTTGQSAEADLARQILEDTEVNGGLIVHLGCGDGRLTAALYAGESYLVHGLDTDGEGLRQAREHIRELGIYGPVSVDRFDGKGLPYAENLVNLVVAEDLGSVATEEVIRVLAPGGVLYARQDGRWKKTVKPRPKNIDEWTHFLHDASGNAVAHDEVVGPPRYLQWNAEPRHTLSHEHTPGINAVVSTGGRIFYIADEAPIASARRTPRWHLVARDAFNGILLWKRPVATWYPHLINWGQAPRELQRKLVAVGDRVYVTLGFHAPLSAVDAATGDTLKVYDETRGTEEIILHKGTLLLAVRTVTDERIAELEKWAQLVLKKDSPVYERESAEPLVSRFRTTERKAATAVLALDAETGQALWKKGDAETAGLRALSLCAEGDGVFYQKGRDVVCLDRKTGQERWSVSSPPLRLVYDGYVVCADGQTVTALAADTGKTRWTQDASLCDVRDAFVAGGSLWLGGFKPWQGRKTGKRGPAWGPYFATERDLSTGKMLMHIEPENPGHHHRCYMNKATDRYILGGRRGTEFIDLKSGDVLWHSWARGVCKYGVMPCNGLLYAPSHACGCYVAAKLTGFNALASSSGQSPATTDDAPRLERGPAYDTPLSARSSPPSGDWPTYRHDAGRSGSTQMPVPAALRRRWQAEIGGKLTSPTVADGRVFLASADEHRVAAIDADSGRPLWHFAAGARVDSPPTLHDGRAIFGCRDGCVYSLQASDGAMAWRLRAARQQRSIAARGQLESAWPVHGSVLVQDGVAYATAGRSSYLDGGIDLCRIDVRTGETLSTTPIYSPDPETGRQPKHFAPASMPGARADILSGDGGHVYLRDMVFDRRGVGLPEGESHLFTLTDFLDDSWAHRSYWIFGTQCSISTGCSGRDKNLIYGRLLVFDESTIYGYGRAGVHWSNQLQDGAYRLFAVKRGEGAAEWQKPMTVRVRAMVLADKVLFVAGPPADAGEGPETREESRKALLLAISASDGTELARYELECPPVFDGMAAAGGRLYIALENGRLVCMDEKGPG